MAGIEKRRGRPPAAGLTAAQGRALAAVERLLARHRYPPTAQEVGEALGIAAASAHELITQLVEKNYLAREPGKARGLRVLRSAAPSGPQALVAIPLLGKVVAGRPVDTPEDADGEVLVDRSLVGGGACFALRVKGDSMKGASIQDGSIVIVRQQAVANSGDIVVAILNGEATVKRLFFDEARVELLPENPRMKPCRVEPDDDLRIMGKVVAVRQVGEE
jgi:repressor LexA